MIGNRMNSVHLPRGMLVDLDDTIIEDAIHADACWTEICGSIAPRLDGLGSARLLDAIFERRDWFWSDPARHREGRLQLRAATVAIVRDALASLGVDDESLAREIGEGYRDLRDSRLRPFPGAVETLEALRRHGVRLALLTNGAAEAQRAKIVRFDLERHFDCIIVEGEFGAGKPERRVYEHALSALGVAPDEAWSIGDNLEWDVGAPQALGVYGIWHDYRGRGLPPEATVKPDRIVRSLRQLVDDES